MYKWKGQKYARMHAEELNQKPQKPQVEYCNSLHNMRQSKNSEEQTIHRAPSKQAVTCERS